MSSLTLKYFAVENVFMKIVVLRLGHRKERDKRISTHCGLVARAFGADEIIYAGEEDEGLVESVNCVSKKWGGKFKAKYEKNWKKVLKNFKGKKVHLTFYGIDQKELPKIKSNLLIVIGSEKVPREVYEMCDFNVSITNQPHSEVAALAVFLNNLSTTKKGKTFGNARIKIFPNPRGKTVEKRVKV